MSFRLLYLGFSLIELLVVMSLIAIMTIVIVPSFQSLTSYTEDRVMASQLVRALHLAQQEAMLRQENITLKKLSEGWQQGYVIMTNKKILHQFLNHKNQGQLHWRGFPIYQEHVEFLRTGFAHAENGTFWYCQKNNTKPRWAIVLNQAGRARMVYPDKKGDIKSLHPLKC